MTIRPSLELEHHLDLFNCEMVFRGHHPLRKAGVPSCPNANDPASTEDADREGAAADLPVPWRMQVRGGRCFSAHGPPYRRTGGCQAGGWDAVIQSPQLWLMALKPRGIDC